MLLTLTQLFDELPFEELEKKICHSEAEKSAFLYIAALETFLVDML